MVDAEQASCIGRVPGKGSRREERCKGRLCHQARNLVPSAAACSTALRHAADYTIPRADTCELTHFHASKRSTNAVCIAHPHGVDFASVKAQVEQTSEWLRVQAPAQSPTQSTEHPERWERPGCCIKHGMQITQNHK